jgi:hypothetical protein
MMQTIWKWQLEITDTQELEVPVGTKFLSTGLDGEGQLCIWGAVDTKQQERYKRLIAITGTGNPSDRARGLCFLGSVTMPPYVWHVFAQQLSEISLGLFL